MEWRRVGDGGGEGISGVRFRMRMSRVLREHSMCRIRLKCHGGLAHVDERWFGDGEAAHVEAAVVVARHLRATCAGRILHGDGWFWLLLEGIVGGVG